MIIIILSHLIFFYTNHAASLSDEIILKAKEPWLTVRDTGGSGVIRGCLATGAANVTRLRPLAAGGQQAKKINGR